MRVKWRQTLKKWPTCLKCIHHLLQCTYTMPSTESFSFIEWRHFFHWATEEWTYTLELETLCQSSDMLCISGHVRKWAGQKKKVKLTIRSVLPATWWAAHCSFSEPLLSSGPAPPHWGLNSLHLSIDHSPCSPETTGIIRVATFISFYAPPDFMSHMCSGWTSSREYFTIHSQ